MWRLSASLIIAKPRRVFGEDECDYELCFVRRSSKSRFLPNACVFPGGVVDESDYTSTGEVCRVAALRETFEETGIVFEPSGTRVLLAKDRVGVSANMHIVNVILPLCEWKTPSDEALRLGPKGGFRTEFFLHVIKEDNIIGETDNTETSQVFWLSPNDIQNTKHAFPFPQRYILDELAQCKKIANLSVLVFQLHKGLFRYPYYPDFVIDQTIPPNQICYAMPGDICHSTYKPLAGAKWMHRGYYCRKTGTPVKFLRSHELTLAATNYTDWCSYVHSSL